MDWTPDEIRRRRDRLGLSQEELGHQLGHHLDKPVSRRAINNWENGHATPHGRNLRALDVVLGDQPDADNPRLSDATFLQLLAALANLHVREVRQAGDPAPDLPPGRVMWRTDDAPTARRATSEGQAVDESAQSTGGQAL